ncbi:MAG: VWA domain-containing protein [Pseudomonadota bacterium]
MAASRPSAAALRLPRPRAGRAEPPAPARLAAQTPAGPGSLPLLRGPGPAPGPADRDRHQGRGARHRPGARHLPVHGSPGLHHRRALRLPAGCGQERGGALRGQPRARSHRAGGLRRGGLHPVPLTLDHLGLASFLGQVRIGQAGERRTAIGDAIAIAYQRLAKLEAPSKIVILLTDGRSNAGSVEPVKAAEAAAALGVKIYTIGVGSEPGQGGGFLGLFSSRGGDLDEPTLEAIAARTGGRYFRAQDSDTLAQVYETIGQLEPSTAEIKELTHYEERFAPWLCWGLGMLALWVLLETTLFRRLP